MSGGEIAALIAAVAFVVLVIFLVLVLYKVSQVVSKIEDTIDETNTTIKVVTSDVNVLSRQVEGLLVKSNELLTDVTQKVATIDPMFTAVADLSESVSALNTSSKHLITKVGTVGKGTAKAGLVSKVGGSAFRAMRSKNKKTNN